MSKQIILGIETSGILCSVAWWQNGSVLLEYSIERKNEHAVILAALVEKGLKELAIYATDVSRVVVGSGPGSFTGLRIGMSYAKGFCYGQSLPLIPVTNFELLSDCVEENVYPIYTLIEAGKGNYYTGVFNRDRSILEEKTVNSLSQLRRNISGEGIVVVHEESSVGYFSQSFDKAIKIINGQYSAAKLCKLGNSKFKKGWQANLNEIEPFYLQAFAGVK
jgi:tRNA threonylcarbamoyladenosine biosynthesis protein TsaB